MAVTITGVGSLPHTDPAAAARFVLDTTDVPYLPQLPLRHVEERMLVQWGDGLGDCGADADGIGLRFGSPVGDRDEAFVGATSLVDRLPSWAPLVKTQAAGPVTLAIGMLAAGHPGHGLWDEVVNGLIGRISAHVVWLRARLPGAQVMVVLDEPALGGLVEPGFPIDAADAAAALGAVLGGIGVDGGVHCCVPTDWAMLARLQPEWLSWDVGALDTGLQESAEEVAMAIAAGTRIIWGACPATPPPMPAIDDLLARLRRAEGALVVAGAPAAALADDMWLSPGCGLAGLTVDQAAQVMGRLRDLAGAVHARR